MCLHCAPFQSQKHFRLDNFHFKFISLSLSLSNSLSPSIRDAINCQTDKSNLSVLLHKHKYCSYVTVQFWWTVKMKQVWVIWNITQSTLWHSKNIMRHKCVNEGFFFFLFQIMNSQWTQVNDSLLVKNILKVKKVWRTSLTAKGQRYQRGNRRKSKRERRKDLR